MSALRNPLAYYIVEAQHIVSAACQPGADKANAVDRLAKLLCTPQANDELLQAGAFAGLQMVSADAKPAIDGSAQ